MNLTSLITAPARLALALGGRVAGLLGGGGQIDDETLQRHVEADVYGSRNVTKSKVQIEVNEGVVWLRGEVKSEAVVNEVEQRAAAIDGVTRVENLLRVAKAPSRARPKARTSQRTQKRPAPKRSSRPKPAAATAPPPDVKPAAPATPPPAAQQEREVTRRFNAERTPAEAEPSPRELAETAQGRQPAPLGSTGSGDSPPAPFPSVANGSGGTNGDTA
ncbi:MAG TPA: BON domain-containing protein [Thermoleophilaceae bacterium]|jgi:hypothetical protein